MATIYRTDDVILPMLSLPDPCPVEVEVGERYVLLRVGPRDWQWERQTGAFVGAGTLLCGPMQSVADSPPVK